ncbi:hypothetical protein DdX_03031 [Ditylenchus destructor]|uniref:Uncharacterized protein n=1 Tax=Ditylenchus destructor TaxID=166010 RepID=A0AAD4RCR3_9BILA|nr:hypothetical protein DdX_03031 [Ditylenchus destructor]
MNPAQAQAELAVARHFFSPWLVVILLRIVEPPQLLHRPCQIRPEPAPCHLHIRAVAGARQPVAQLCRYLLSLLRDTGGVAIAKTDADKGTMNRISDCLAHTTHVS